MQRHGGRGGGRRSQDVRRPFKIRCLGVSLRQDLHHAVGDTFVGEPAERHVRSRIAVDVRHHAVRLLFRHKRCTVILQKRNERWHSIIL